MVIMNSLIDLIIQEKANRKAVFVFPSEAAAEYWRKQSLRILNQKAVRNDRFVSWDSFKEDITSHDRREKPVNSVLRRLFSADIVRRNSSGDPLFSRLIPPEYSGQSGIFSDTVLRILPELKVLVERLETADFDQELKDDYNLMYRSYLDFLSRNGLFEPSWEFPEIEAPGRDFHIIFPEIIEDFPQWAQILSDAGCGLLSGVSDRRTSFNLYENSVIETDEILCRTASLLESGVSPSSIVISSADEQISALLSAKAELRGLPISSRQGMPLSDYPAGRLPELIRECRQSGYSINSMKGLLLFRAFNWKEAGLAAALISFGIENRCLKNTASSVYGDVWAARLKAAGRNELLAFYRKLRGRIEAFTGCSTFAELSGELQIFISTFLDTDSENWDSGCEMVFQRTREVLSSLKIIESGLTDILVADPLGLWIEILQEKIYVQQSPGPGVTIYPYRVSAGIKPEYHFVAGLSHEGANITSKSFAFLTDQQRKEIDADELNMSEDFLSIYSASGDEVIFSGATETPGGVALPPGRFIEDSSVVRISTGLTEASDPFCRENLWWAASAAGGRLTALPLEEVQKDGFLYARDTFMSGRGFDATKESVPDCELLDTVISERSDENGLLRVSASALNRWSECPFLFLMGDVLKVAEDEYILKPEDPMTAGIIMHEILFEFFSELKNEKQAFSSRKADQYRRLIAEKAETVFTRWENEENYFYGPAWDALKRKAVKSLQLFPDAEAEFYDEMEPACLETWLDKVFEDEKIKAGGFIDRISGDSDSSVVVDYKKSWSKVAKSKFIQLNEDGHLMKPEAGYQLPFYLLLAEAAGFKDAASSYYSITAGTHYPVSGDSGVLDEEDVNRLVDLTVSEIKRMADSIRNGRFEAPERCDGCGLRAVCRKRYNIRWEE